MFKPAKMKKFNLIIAQGYADDVIRTLGELGVAHFVDVREKLEDYEGLVEIVEPSDKYFRLSTLSSRIDTLVDQLHIPVTLRPTPKTLISVERELSEKSLEKFEMKVKEIEERSSGTVSRLGELESIEDRSPEMEDEMKELQTKRDSMTKDYSMDLLALKETIELEKRTEEIRTMFGKTGQTYVIEGWIPKKNEKIFTEKINEITENTCFLELSKPTHSSHSPGSSNTGDTPPTLLQNPGFMSPVEELTKSYGTPSYNELDPTFLMWVTFPIIFGMMFGDIGHGALLLLAGLAGVVAYRKGLVLSEFMMYVVKGGGLLAASGISSIFFGFMYGEFFGYHIIHEVWYIQAVEPLRPVISAMSAILFRYDPLAVDPTGPLWIDPFEHTMVFFKATLFVGVVHMSIGLIFSLINKLKNKEFVHAFFEPGCWLWFYLGAAYIVLYIPAFGVSNIFDWFGNVVYGLSSPILMFFLLPLILMFVGNLLIGMRSGEGATGLMVPIEAFISSLSNTISYGRILALAMVHKGFAQAAITLSGPFGGPMYFIILPLFTFMIIMMLEGLVVFIHVVRLHWVEFFLKFYKGEGVEYTPFTLKRTYTILRG
ncbi:MAG: V-type ATP synthase subunit I [Promethearchaeota archaeon]